VQRREQGNACYRAGAWRRAFNRYVLAAAAVAQAGRDHSFDAAQRARARQEQLRVGLNVAAVALQLGDGETALAQCAEALVLDPSLLKGWWRQGKARLLLGDAEGAVSDLTRAEQLVGRPAPPATRFNLSFRLEFSLCQVLFTELREPTDRSGQCQGQGGGGAGGSRSEGSETATKAAPAALLRQIRKERARAQALLRAQREAQRATYGRFPAVRPGVVPSGALCEQLDDGAGHGVVAMAAAAAAARPAPASADDPALPSTADAADTAQQQQQQQQQAAAAAAAAAEEEVVVALRAGLCSGARKPQPEEEEEAGGSKRRIQLPPPGAFVEDDPDAL
jgi:tetratricopeptide (TPR) repeat protein